MSGDLVVFDKVCFKLYAEVTLNHNIFICAPEAVETFWKVCLAGHEVREKLCVDGIQTSWRFKTLLVINNWFSWIAICILAPLPREFSVSSFFMWLFVLYRALFWWDSVFRFQRMPFCMCVCWWFDAYQCHNTVTAWRFGPAGPVRTASDPQKCWIGTKFSKETQVNPDKHYMTRSFVQIPNLSWNSP